MSDRISVKKQTKWIQLSLFKNCFNDGEKTHLGFKYNKEFYCLTHSEQKLEVPKKCLRMRTESADQRPTYLCKATSKKPELVNTTKMRISKPFFYNNVIRNNPDYYIQKEENL